jgi:16S rRNA (cytosine1407-C5)-methyltransferase
MPTDLAAYDRYAHLTDLAALKAISETGLRKSIRVNTLKRSVEDFRTYAASKNWQLTPVPWCAEAFYLDRENREEAVGKDIAHLLGEFYIQEAASMLPASLLDAQPGETILDMSAAPGSKTTMLAARMANTGVIIANDVQEKRLWTLKGALNRSGVTNTIVIKKVGQWYAKHMTERFDRVLCDAPCSAQGTVRKDSDALRYASLENIEKMSRLQFSLLEAAIHAAKVGGRIVYSTCTLAPEENEQLVNDVLARYPGQVEVVDPRELGIAPDGYWDPAIADAIRVQQAQPNPTPNPHPYLRLWPQTYDTEGFFCAVLRKVATTKDPTPMDMVPFVEDELPKRHRQEVEQFLAKYYGGTFLRENERLYQRGEHYVLVNADCAYIRLPVVDYALGLPFGKTLPEGRVLPAHEIITLRGSEAVDRLVDISDEDRKTLFAGKDIACDPALKGHVVIRQDGRCLGLGLAKEGRLKNNLPRWMIGAGERSHR